MYLFYNVKFNDFYPGLNIRVLFCPLHVCRCSPFSLDLQRCKCGDFVVNNKIDIVQYMCANLSMVKQYLEYCNQTNNGGHPLIKLDSKSCSQSRTNAGYNGRIGAW